LLRYNLNVVYQTYNPHYDVSEIKYPNRNDKPKETNTNDSTYNPNNSPNRISYIIKKKKMPGLDLESSAKPTIIIPTPGQNKSNTNATAAIALFDGLGNGLHIFFVFL
jgi:hypothetical protein